MSVIGSEVEAGAGPARRWPVSASIIVGALVVIAIIAIGVFVYLTWANETTALEEGAQADIERLAVLKARQVEDWRTERLLDAGAVTASRPFADEVARILHPDAPGVLSYAEAHEQIVDDLGIFTAKGAYVSAMLVGADGRLLVVGERGDAELSPVTRASIAAVAATGDAVIGDPWIAEPDGDIHLDVAAPVLDRDGGTAAVVLLRVDPDTMLYPRTLGRDQQNVVSLVVQDGDRVRFLNSVTALDDDDTGGLLPTVAIDDVDDPAVDAVLKPDGSYLRENENGTVTAYATRSIAGSAWHLVVTNDVSKLHHEGFENALELVQRIGGVALVAVLVAAVLFLARQRRLLRRAVAAERERAVATERYDQLLAHARDVVLLLDESGQILDANETAVTSYGYDAATLRTMRLADLRVPDEQWSVARDLEAARAPGGATFETVHRRKDGVRVPVEVSTHAVAVPGGTHFESVVRDMSDRKDAEQAIRRQLDELRRWQAGTIGREERILTLKAEVNDLLEAAGQPPKYGSVLEGAPDHAG